MCVAWLTAFLVGCGTSSPATADLAWIPVNAGPRSHGPVLSLLIDRSTPGKLLAGLNAERSLYASNDGGSTWMALPLDASSSASSWSPPTYALLQSVRSPSLVMAATGEGLYRSSDGGRNWSATGPGAGPRAVYALAQDGSGVLYLGGEGAAVLRSMDDGLSWQALSALSAGGAILSLAVSPSADWLLAGTDGAGLFSSRDQGASWQRVDAAGDTFVSSIVLQPGGKPPCDGAGGCVLARTRSGLLATLDGGRTWRMVEAGWDGRVDAVAISGSSPAWVLATDRGQLYRSVNGERWVSWGEGIGRRGAVFFLASDPRRPDRLFAGTENGLYFSADGGLRWQAFPGGPGAPSANALAQGADGLLYLANLDGVYASPDGGSTWERRSQGLPPVPILAVAVAPSAPNVVYAGANGAGLFRSDDRGLTWEATSWDGASVPGIAVDAADSNRVFFRVAFERVYSSADGGKSVQASWTGFTPFTEVMSLAIDARQSNRLIAGGTDMLFRSLDGGASWQPVAPELNGQTVFTVLFDGAAGDRLLAGATNGIYASGDGGGSWQRWGTGLEDITVTALARDPILRNRLYAGARHGGVYRSDDGGQTWRPAGLEGLSVDALLVSSDGRWLYAATPGGFFHAEVR
jgi:photosystem II stability/assembly factor-like uncharacterized protein